MPAWWTGFAACACVPRPRGPLERASKCPQFSFRSGQAWLLTLAMLASEPLAVLASVLTPQPASVLTATLALVLAYA